MQSVCVARTLAASAVNQARKVCQVGATSVATVAISNGPALAITIIRPVINTRPNCITTMEREHLRRVGPMEIETAAARTRAAASSSLALLTGAASWRRARHCSIVGSMVERPEKPPREFMAASGRVSRSNAQSSRVSLSRAAAARSLARVGLFRVSSLSVSADCERDKQTMQTVRLAVSEPSLIVAPKWSGACEIRQGQCWPVAPPLAIRPLDRARPTRSPPATRHRPRGPVIIHLVSGASASATSRPWSAMLVAPDYRRMSIELESIRSGHSSGRPSWSIERVKVVAGNKLVNLTPAHLRRGSLALFLLTNQHLRSSELFVGQKLPTQRKAPRDHRQHVNWLII